MCKNTKNYIYNKYIFNSMCENVCQEARIVFCEREENIELLLVKTSQSPMTIFFKQKTSKAFQ